jgi:sarcosine oxidase subunit gamma
MTAMLERPLRRLPLHRWHLVAGAELVGLGGTEVPWRYPPPFPQIERCALVDLSGWPRIGVKGWRAWEVLGCLGIESPVVNNSAGRIAGGGLCLRLGNAEALLLGGLDGAAPEIARVVDAPVEEGAYTVPRRDSHFWFALCGAAAPTILARLCAVDCRYARFADFGVAQTMVGQISALIVRHDRPPVPVFHLLGDGASAFYLWGALFDACRDEVGGTSPATVAGLEFLRSLDRYDDAQRRP